MISLLLVSPFDASSPPLVRKGISAKPLSDGGRPSLAPLDEMRSNNEEVH